ncbi:hypothetical protein GRI39_00380 [Altererythrobacter indicus]|uniref:Lipoprotein n=1 Tax=Altericroceibacterium indicum TaxID=374177 RepID=A0A845A7G4_9SPHN|nr:hypothetical protein [Altericroceibacterium indicum]MXP24506.1 hypothetical protein [Altericroceibacterium indicum]
MMKSNAASLFPLIAAGCATLALSACATPRGEYPSLAIRPEERVSGSMKPVAAEPYIPPKTGPDVLSNIAGLRQSAEQAHAQFTAAVPAARKAANAARNSSQGSEKWAVAQIALSELESSRSDAMIALADLDRLYVDAAINAKELGPLASARNDVMALVAQEDSVIDQIGALLR